MAAKAKAVLVIDDDRDVREAIVEVLQDSGFEVSGAESAERAMELLPALLRPCLILLDHVMPGMGGEGFLRFMSKHAEGVEFPILIISASKVEPGNSHIVVGVLRKPFEEEALIYAVESHCERR